MTSPTLNCLVCANPWTDERGVRCARVEVQAEHCEVHVPLRRGEAVGTPEMG